MNLSKENTFRRITYLIFALISYVIYLFSIVVFVLRLLDATQLMGPFAFEFQIGSSESICLNIGLIAIFGVPHSVMARAGFKKYCQRIIPLPIERSFYVFIASITLIALSCLWQPIYSEIWNIQNSFWKYAVHSIFIIGSLLAVVSTFLIDHFELFGLRQAWNFFARTQSRASEFYIPSLYKLVRHPMMLGMILVLWSTPSMNLGHLILSLGMTIYIIIGTFFEERDLIRNFSDKYLQYKQAVPMLIPFFMLKQKITKN
ncbi:NnrU family protein [Leptospira venezuelensis]|uniref:methyltransferase family protein n=1 Tax=Leptospira venezuelensis TaxID=1958811 RepID=UPI001F262562|nr:NnrU family protein [Leptospira venezuelensis]